MEVLANLQVNIFQKHIIKDKVFKNGPGEICGRQPLKDFTWAILDYFVPLEKQCIFLQATHKTKKEIAENPRAMAKMLKEARRVRQVLSANTDHIAQIENVFEEQNFRLKVTRTEFEDMCEKLLRRVNKPVKMAVEASSIPMVNYATAVIFF